MMSDKNIESLQTKANLESIKTDAWLRENKLLLNSNKTKFMVINKNLYINLLMQTFI